MNIATILSVASNVRAALECYELVEKLLDFGLKSDLYEFKRTVEILTAVLLDAESKTELTHETTTRIRHIRSVFYEADDLLDEFVSLARQQRLIDTDGSLVDKVRLFFSSSNPFFVCCRISRGIKDMKKKFDGIGYNKQFSLITYHELIRNPICVTCSSVNDEVPIIGREQELECIIDMLLDSNVQQQNTSNFLSIVGVGGLGKTALAKLVYNDPRISTAFPLRMWTCVSDQYQQQLDVAEVLFKILASATNNKKSAQRSRLDWLLKKLQEKLAGKKYFLVLDDVWTKNRAQWSELQKYLIGISQGRNWILVTTRSEETAAVVGDGLMYRLQSLSVRNSWRLFRSAAFGSDASNAPENLVEIGREIVNRCAGVPLAIKVMGSTLKGQDVSMWESFQTLESACIKDTEENIISILEQCYNHLDYPLKSCFSYTALFPKNYEFKKEMLQNLWMAQGYISSLHIGCQSMEDVSEDYFLILLRRCFFQDIQRDEDGEIHSVKIHDLMHDIARSVSRDEIYAAEPGVSNLQDTNNCRHFSTSHFKEGGKYFTGETSLRSFLSSGDKFNDDSLKALVEGSQSLRVLSLTNSQIRTFPKSIGKLEHLRYLDLSGNEKMEVLPDSIGKLVHLRYLKVTYFQKMKALPESIGKLVNLRSFILSYNENMEVLPKSTTNLYNLKNLILRDCLSLKELPEDFSRLVNLRNLEVSGCDNLRFMPKPAQWIEHQDVKQMLWGSTPTGRRYQLGGFLTARLYSLIGGTSMICLHLSRKRKPPTRILPCAGYRKGPLPLPKPTNRLGIVAQDFEIRDLGGKEKEDFKDNNRYCHLRMVFWVCVFFIVIRLNSLMEGFDSSVYQSPVAFLPPT